MSIEVRLRELMEAAVATGRLSLNTAREIEGIIAVYFPLEQKLQDLADALAEFSPSGGEFLFSEHDILPKFQRALDPMKLGRLGLGSRRDEI